MREALAQGGPALLVVIVDPDALFMPPKLELAQVTRFGMRNLREAFDA